MSLKKTVAVFFGGQSVEHDISILTGLQMIEALDATKYDAFPVYVDPQGGWWVGEALLHRKNYKLSTATKKTLQQVVLPVGESVTRKVGDRPALMLVESSLFGRKKTIPFDIALNGFHGTFGEDGAIQGLWEMMNVPYTGARVLASAAFMNKALTKQICRQGGVPVLDDVVVRLPEKNGEFVDIAALLPTFPFPYPVCVKPNNLGSSVGVSKATNDAELGAAMLDVFKLDDEAIIEPFVDHLTEYNVAVTQALGGGVRLSAIERPLRKGEVLDFADKYLSAGTMESKLSVPMGEGMASATREFHPSELTDSQRDIILHGAAKIFELLGGRGAPRIDFLCNAQTGALWLNEVNALPGSAGYYLWEAATPRVGFAELLDALLQEGLNEAQCRSDRLTDGVSAKSGIFPDRAA